MSKIFFIVGDDTVSKKACFSYFKQYEPVASKKTYDGTNSERLNLLYKGNIVNIVFSASFDDALIDIANHSIKSKPNCDIIVVFGLPDKFCDHFKDTKTIISLNRYDELMLEHLFR